MVSLGQGGSWIGRKFLVNLRNVCIPQRWWWTLVDLGYTFMVSLGQGGSWIGRKFLVNLRNVCIPQRWWWTLDTPLWFPWARVNLG